MKIRRFKWVLLTFLLLLLALYTLRFTTIFDEDYSLQLIHNSYLNMIKLDSYDVHPPLFYILVKIFLKITTFWTNSLLVKILFSRIFSIIISFITFVFLTKIFNLIHVDNNIFIQIISFLMVPGVISFTYELIKIRMYSLGAMFVVIEFYELVQYFDDHKKRYLFLSLLVSILSVYTNYYSALISGLLLLIYMCKYLFNHEKYWINMFSLGIILIASFIPWVPIFIKQLKLTSSHTQSNFIKQWLATVMFFLLFLYPLIWSFKHSNVKLARVFMISFITLFILILLMSLISITSTSVFQFRYVYPIFIVYGSLGVNMYFIMFKQCKAYNKLISVFVLMILCFGCCFAYIDQEMYYGLSSIHIVKEFHYWTEDKNNTIYLKRSTPPDYNFDFEKMMYLSRLNKRIYSPTIGFRTKSNIAYRKLFLNLNKHTIYYN